MTGKIGQTLELTYKNNKNKNKNVRNSDNCDIRKFWTAHDILNGSVRVEVHSRSSWKKEYFLHSTKIHFL